MMPIRLWKKDFPYPSFSTFSANLNDHFDRLFGIVDDVITCEANTGLHDHESDPFKGQLRA